MFVIIIPGDGDDEEEARNLIHSITQYLIVHFLHFAKYGLVSRRNLLRHKSGSKCTMHFNLWAFTDGSPPYFIFLFSPSSKITAHFHFLRTKNTHIILSLISPLLYQCCLCMDVKKKKWKRNAECFCVEL